MISRQVELGRLTESKYRTPYCGVEETPEA